VGQNQGNSGKANHRNQVNQDRKVCYHNSPVACSLVQALEEPTKIGNVPKLAIYHCWQLTKAGN
jgi:hypothetical protein